MNPKISATLKRFFKTFVSTLVSGIALLPTFTPSGWGDVSTYLHSLLFAAVVSLIMALEKFLMYSENLPNSVPSAPAQSSALP